MVFSGISLLGAAACLPLARRNPPPPTAFGAEMYWINSGGGLNQMAAAKMSWVRRNAVVWSSIESTEGKFNWSAMKSLNVEMKNASNKGMQLVLIVRSTPKWARKINGTGPSCGPISQSKLPAFGNFMHALVARYSVAPYHVKYWELWNEPDIAASNYPGDNIFGCWGDPSDAYYGGGYYAEMLKVVYPQIKAADPQAQVIVGGLLMDCDPRLGAGCETFEKSNLPPRFLEGILRNNGAAYFDGVSFHSYDYYQGQAGYYSNSTWQSTWNSTGPVFISKATFIQNLLTEYGAFNKFLMNTETALLCDNCSNDSTFEITKAYYLTESYAAAIAQGLRANIWYSVLGWNNSGLLDAHLRPLPAYTAFKFSRSELRDSAWVRDITTYLGIKGYEFNRGDRRIWVLWSLDGSTHSISLSSAPLAGWDALGVSVTPDTSMNITWKPLYLEWNP
jgi:Cellulase (glycosyl hydrolase family 5)